MKSNAAQTDATLVTGGKPKLIGTQTWVYSDEVQYLQSNTQVARDSLSLETPQQNSSITHPQTGQSANQLATLYSIGVPSPPVAAVVATLPRYDDPEGSTGGTLSQRARSCLHTNCVQCNRTGGPTPVNIDFRCTTSLAASNACDVVDCHPTAS
jgi:hypothetical protein